MLAAISFTSFLRRRRVSHSGAEKVEPILGRCSRLATHIHSRLERRQHPAARTEGDRFAAPGVLQSHGPVVIASRRKQPPIRAECQTADAHRAFLIRPDVACCAEQRLPIRAAIYCGRRTGQTRTHSTSPLPTGCTIDQGLPKDPLHRGAQNPPSAHPGRCRVLAPPTFREICHADIYLSPTNGARA
jgi:hypothetical protein